jgi:hypothetical protein
MTYLNLGNIYAFYIFACLKLANTMPWHILQWHVLIRQALLLFRPWLLESRELIVIAN